MAGGLVTHTLFNEMTAAQGRITNLGLRPVQRPDFSIFKEGSNYYRRDGKDGIVDASGSDFAAILTQSLSEGRCVELLGLSSSLVDFTLNSTVTIPKGVTIKSNPGSVRIKLANSVNKDMLVISDTTGDQYDYVWLDGLHLDGNRTNQTSGKGIVLHQTCNISLREIVYRCLGRTSTPT